MKRELTLLQQAQIEKRRLQFADRSKINSSMNMSEILELMLPNYDQGVKSKIWHAKPQLHKGRKGGVRSGKTFSLEGEAIGLSYVNRPYLHLSMSPTFDLAVATVVDQVLMRHCDDNGLEYDWKKSSQLFRIIHGPKDHDIANIYVFGADQAFKGITAASGDINEPFSIAKSKFTLWWERISDVRSRRLARIWGGTAEPENMEWGHEYFKDETIETPEFYADTITTYENEKYLPKGYVKELEDKYDEKRRQVYMLGKNLNLAGGTVYAKFDSQKHTIKQIDLDKIILKNKLAKIVLSFDFNVDPVCCSELFIVGNIRYQSDEYHIHGSDTDEICELVINRVKEKYKDHRLSIVVTGDATGGSPKSSSRGRSDHRIVAEYFILSKLPATISFEKTNPEQKDRANDVNKLIESGLYIISDKCVETIKDRELVKWKRGAEGFKIDKSDSERTHHSDSADYGLLITKRMGIDSVESDDEGQGYQNVGSGISVLDERNFK